MLAGWKDVFTFDAVLWQTLACVLGLRYFYGSFSFLFGVEI